MEDKDFCCPDIIEVTGRVNALEGKFTDYQDTAQRWRDEHDKKNNEALSRLGGRVDAMDSAITKGFKDINEKLTTFVNPVLAIIISLLTALLGAAVGALLALAQHL